MTITQIIIGVFGKEKPLTCNFCGESFPAAQTVPVSRDAGSISGDNVICDFCAKPGFQGVN